MLAGDGADSLVGDKPSALAAKSAATSVVAPRVLVIACGAIAHEVVALRRQFDWANMQIQCLPAELHNRPERITPAIEQKLDELAAQFDVIFVAYGDCGTGGMLDALLEQRGIERIPGAHCYEFFAGNQAFFALSDAEPGTFYLTDFLARNFERLILRGLGIERHPELEQMYFGNYRKLVYLQQSAQAHGLADAKAAAQRLGLAFEHHFTGYGELAVALVAAVAGEQDG